MRVVEIECRKENVGIVREGATGARTELVHKDGKRYCFAFFSYRGQLKLTKAAVEGRVYVVGPDFIKRRPALDKDNYWPRRWARQNGVAHMSFFKLMTEGDVYRVPSERRLGEGVDFGTPKTVYRVSIKPLNGFPFAICLVNKRWMEKSSFVEFSWEMEAPENRNR